MFRNGPFIKSLTLNFRVGFTLIELLIVVAIVAILAAIAVPNFLLAQTRTKVTRAIADQKNISTAIELYASDNSGKYPAYNNPKDRGLSFGEPVVFLPVTITTPIAYISTLPVDIFSSIRTGVEADKTNPFFYMHNYETVYLGRLQPFGHVSEHYFRLTGEQKPVQWTTWSYGPDLKDDHGVILYDPTNGTVSRGDLMRFGP